MNPILFYRKRKKLTQEQLEELSGVSRRMICYYEKSKEPPKYSIVLKFCKIFGIKPDTLMSKYFKEGKRKPLR
jgi:transcriptional regulator with XRE-family HTH domain